MGAFLRSHIGPLCAELTASAAATTSEPVALSAYRVAHSMTLLRLETLRLLQELLSFTLLHRELIDVRTCASIRGSKTGRWLTESRANFGAH